MNANAHRRVLQWASFARTWHIFDANMQCPFKTANLLIPYLQGKNKPIYDAESDCGDHVVVINTKHIAMKDQMWRTWKHFNHTGYPGGFSATRVYKVHDVDPTRVLYKQIYATLPGNLWRKKRMARLHLFPNEEVPGEILKNVSAQIPQIMEVPKRLDEYSQEEIQNFPKVFDWPKDYVYDKGQWEEDRVKKTIKRFTKPEEES